MLSINAAAQDKEKPKKSSPAAPRAIYLAPPAVPTGYQGKLRIHGQELKTAKEVTSTAQGVEVKFLKSESVTVPLELAGTKFPESAVEIEINLADSVGPGEVPLLVKTPLGESMIRLQVIERAECIVPEKDPGNGFRTALPVTLGKIISGGIEIPRDVDVFELKLAADRPFIAETLSARRGSPCDPLLTLFDERGRIMISNDDHASSRDARLEYTPAADGVYYLSLLEAHDRGHESFRYLLRVEQAVK